MTCPRVFIKTLLPSRASRSTISTITLCRPASKFSSSQAPFSTQQTVVGTSPPPASDPILLSSYGSKKKKESKEISTGLKQDEKKTSKRSTRVYPLRKQFIYQSYLDLFTSNQVCLLFKHESLSAREWNSIRGQIKNLSSPLPSATSTSFGEYKFTEKEQLESKKQQVPRVQVLRTKMILPVLKKLLKESKIDKEVFRSLAYGPLSSDPKDIEKFRPSHLIGPLFSITQSVFQPDQIKKIINILKDYSKPLDNNNQLVSTPKQDHKISSSSKKTTTTKKVEFLIGLIDQKNLCKNQEDLKTLSNLDSLDSLRSKIVSLLNLPSQNLLFNLNFARASNLIYTLNSHINTQQQKNQLTTTTTTPSDNQSSHPQ